MKRRHFLQFSSLLGLATSVPAVSLPAGPVTFVLIHGAWHSSACWARLTPLLTAAGHRVLALDLPGHGTNARFPRPGQRSPLADLTLEDAAQAVLATLKTLPRPRVLVGHSMAGHVLSRVAELAPGEVDQLVYLSAFMPVERPSFADYMTLPEARTEYVQSLILGDPVQLGASRIDPHSSDPDYQRRLHLSFYGDVSEEDFRAFGNGLTPDQPFHFFADSPRISRERWGRVPRAYLVLEKDQALPLGLQERFVREADAFVPANPTRVRRLASSHSPFASMPDKLAETLLNLI
jgi:pimeloyl-ACP methyl ester carboxylesterase